MSYSFHVRTTSKAAAKAAVAAELDKVVASQPVHERDREAAQATADAMIDHLPDNDTADVSVSVHGSIATSNDTVQSVSVGANATLLPREIS